MESGRTSATTTTLVATVPAGVVTGPLAVSNANGSATTAQPFTVLFPPTITSITPSAVGRGTVTLASINGTQLASARAVSFNQAGITARVVRAESDQLLTVELSAAANVPLGSYNFFLTNEADTVNSGSVTVTVSTALLGDVVAATKPYTVHVPAVIPGAPAGNALSVTTGPISIHLPALIPGAPAGNAMTAAQAVSVHVPALISGAPPGNAMSVATPLSVSMP